jgi:hypothetical protein
VAAATTARSIGPPARATGHSALLDSPVDAPGVFAAPGGWHRRSTFDAAGSVPASDRAEKR